MRQTSARTITAAALLFALSLAACSLASEPIPAGPIETGPMPGETAAGDVPASLPSAGQGELIYLENCIACHGAGGAGDGEVSDQIRSSGIDLPDFSSAAFASQRSPQEWYAVITAGRVDRLMPPWTSLSDQQRWDAAYYLYTLSAPAETLAQGEALYEAHFAVALGEQGEAAGLNDPAVMAGLSRQAIIDGYLRDAGSGLSDEELLAAAAYVQTFGYDASLETISLDTPDLGGEDAAEAPAESTAEPPAEEAEAEPANVVSGQVIMSSPGYTLPEGLQISLRGLAVDDAGQVYEFLAKTAPLEADGSYRFEDAPFDTPRSAYVVEVYYQGVQFTTGQIIDAANPRMEIDLPIYEITSDESVVAIDALHLIVQEHPDALLITEVYVFSNSSDRVFVTDEPVSGGLRGSVAISLPPDAYGVTFEDGELGGRYVQAADRIYDTEQVLPGTGSHTVVVNYFLPYDGPREVEVPLLYATTQVTLLMQEGQQARSDQLSEAGVSVLQNVSYEKYIGLSLPAGETLSFRVTRPAGGGNLLPSALAALAGVLIAGGVVYWFVQRRSSGPAPVAGLAGEQEALLRQIAELDDAFAEGKLNRFEYEACRAELKASLIESLEG